MDCDVIIIGAGLSGLAAGIRLAHFGHRVRILEKHTRPGGLNSYYSFQGHILDVGLHAITNYVPRSTKSTPLAKMLRQLRLSYDDLELCPQKVSSIRFPQKELRFTNDFQFLLQEIAGKFPLQIDRFVKLVDSLSGYDDFSLGKEQPLARQVLQSFLSDPLLIEMLLCPLMFYGNNREDDMDFAQFSVLFRSIFCEGLARPRQGMRKILQLLVQKYRDCGGELITNCGVQKLQIHQDRMVEVQLVNGQTMQAEKVISSIGLPETRALCSQWNAEEPRPGVVSFIESILFIDDLPSNFPDLDTAIMFYNNAERFVYRRPKGPIDPSSGVICCPDNYQSAEPPTEGIIRLTHLANFDLWDKSGEEKGAAEYRVQKEACFRESVQKAEQFVPGLSRFILAHDTFTPKTIQKFTGRQNGAVYGTTDKADHGQTPVKNLFVCGTDQGFVGIVGVLLSGITVANMHVLY